MDQYEQLKSTIQGSTGPGTGAPAPILGGYPELQRFYDSSFQAPFANAASSALSTNTDINVANAKAAAAAARSRSGAGKPKRVRKDDGGFAFYDDEGNEITAKQFADLTNNDVTDVLSGSENPIDIQYMNDYKNLHDYIVAKSTGNSEALSQFDENQVGSLSPSDVLKRFRLAYPTVYGQGGFSGPGTAGQTLGSSFIPRSSAPQDF